jgi:hypothetical protein
MPEQFTQHLPGVLDGTEEFDVRSAKRARHSGGPNVTITVKQIAAWGREVSTQAGTTYTAVLRDLGTRIRFTNGSPVVFTLPLNSVVPFPINTEIELEQAGAGALSVATGGGVTVNSLGGDLILGGQYAVALLKQVAADTWVLSGQL